MKLLIRIILIMICISLTFGLVITIILKANQQLLTKEAAKEMVEKRYDGKVKNVENSDNNNEFKVNSFDSYY